jgi:hypothetical protein
LVGALTPAIAPLSASADGAESPDFVVHTNSFAFDHAPTWGVHDDTVLYHHDDGTGMQIHEAKLDGSHARCITCGLAGPNMVASYRPQGDKVLFHSWNGHNLTIGGPGFGGLGSTFWVINPDGTKPVELTPPDMGTEGMDNFHAYFSPDGKKIAWTHIDWNFVTAKGSGKWSVWVADYVDNAKGPHLENLRQVRPENGHFYETDWWSPDGRGFLFTESSDSAVDLDLYYYELATGKVTRLTNNHTWTEQAIFTPDGKKVIYMSIKDHEGAWAGWSKPTSTLNLTPQYDYLILLPLFFGIFLTPAMPPACDLYEIDLATGLQRRLTHDGDAGYIIPEVAFDNRGRRLMWTELKTRDGIRVDQDPTRQLQDLQDLLQNPPPAPKQQDLHTGGELPDITWRTRIAEYTRPAGAVAGATTAAGAILPDTGHDTLPFTAAGSPVLWLVAGIVLAAVLWVGIAEFLRRRAVVSRRELAEVDVAVKERLARL